MRCATKAPSRFIAILRICWRIIIDPRWPGNWNSLFCSRVPVGRVIARTRVSLARPAGTRLQKRLVSSHFELSAQNPMQDAEQTQRRGDQHDRVEDEQVHFQTEIAFLFAEENIQLPAAPVIALLHLGV